MVCSMYMYCYDDNLCLIFHVDYRAMLAIGCLLYMTPHVKKKADHTRVVSILEVRTCMF